MDRIDPPPTVHLDEVAGWLGYTPTYFRNNKLHHLVLNHGFPARLPGSLSMYSRSAVLAWIEANDGRPTAEILPFAPAAQAPAEPPAPPRGGRPRLVTLEDVYGAGRSS